MSDEVNNLLKQTTSTESMNNHSENIQQPSTEQLISAIEKQSKNIGELKAFLSNYSSNNDPGTFQDPFPTAFQDPFPTEEKHFKNCFIALIAISIIILSLIFFCLYLAMS